MYVGHLAVGLAIQAKYPKVPALPIMLGVGFLDIVDGLFIMLGVNRVTPNLESGPYLFFDLTFIDWDHSLLMALILSALWGACFLKDKRVAWFAALACFSHWVTDRPMHNMDLALYPYATQHFGYGLWGKWGIGSWVFEGVFSAVLLAYAWYLFAKRQQSLCWVALLMLFSFVQLSPWLSPMKVAAVLPEPTASLVHGLLVFLGFLVPGVLLAWLLEREKAKPIMTDAHE